MECAAITCAKAGFAGKPQPRRGGIFAAQDVSPGYVPEDGTDSRRNDRNAFPNRHPVSKYFISGREIHSNAKYN
jgi:hypothetical protein